MEEANDLIRERLAKLEALKREGVYPYGARHDKSSSINELVERFEEGKTVSTAGRMTAFRSHGKSAFCDLRDSTGRVQAYFKLDVVGEKAFKLLGLLDLGDFIGVKGEFFKTHTGEPTIKVVEVTLLSKGLRPLPEKWHGLKDIETRYRQRYLDLISNEDSRKIFKLRSLIISKIRMFFDSRGYLEVETPMLHQIPGGAAGRPFQTHHNAFDIDLYLRIAPELYLKKLLVGGFEKVYEINKSFRNEGISTRHNPEFTMLEAYTAYSDCEGMMRLTEDLISHLAKEIFGTTKMKYKDEEIDLTPPWKRVSFAECMSKIGIRPGATTAEWAEGIKKIRKDKPGEKLEKLTRSQLAKVVEDLLEPQADAKLQPTFFIDIFSEFCPLAKSKTDNPLIADRFELLLAGIEVANAYSELNDPIEQKKRFEEQVAAGDEDIKVVDYDFVEALEYGMPPAGGLGIGIDRLVMIFAGCDSIRDVILFPQLKPIGK